MKQKELTKTFVIILKLKNPLSLWFAPLYIYISFCIARMCSGMSWDKDGDMLAIVNDQSGVVFLWDSNSRKTTQMDSGFRWEWEHWFVIIKQVLLLMMKRVLNLSSAGTFFIRQNLTSVDVRFWRKDVMHWNNINIYSSCRPRYSNENHKYWNEVERAN